MKTSTLSHPLQPTGAIVDKQRRERHRRIRSLIARLIATPFRNAGAQRFEMTRERELLGPVGTEFRRAWWL